MAGFDSEGGSRVTGVFCGLGGSLVRIILISALAIASVVIGALNLKDCPAEKYIPIYLVVSGSVGIALGIIGVIHQKSKRDGGEESQQCNICMALEGLMQLFMLAWLIAGSVWVYRTYGHVQHTNSALPDFCDKTTFWYTFVTITLGYCLMGLAIVIAFLVCCCACCCACCKSN